MENNIRILNGRYIREEAEKSQLIESMSTKGDFVNLLKEIQSEVPLTVEELEVQRAYLYDFQDGDNVGTAQHITLKSKKNDVQISYQFALLNSKTVDNMYGRFIDKEQNYVIYEVHKGKVELLEKEQYQNQLELKLEEDNQHDESFKPLSSEPNEISAQWDTGCLRWEARKRDYRHCGSGCGDNLKEGGGTPVNAIDSCCRNHDRCWKNFGSWDRCCDRDFVNCANRNESVDGATQNQIWLAFAWSGKLC